MVNTEHQLIQHLQALQPALQTKIVTIGIEFATRLFKGGHLELANIAAYTGRTQAFVQDTLMPQTEVAELPVFLEKIRAPVLKTYAEFLALDYLAEGFRELELELLEYLTCIAKKEINTIQTYPHQASDAARYIETLECVSPTRGKLASTLAANWQSLGKHFETTLSKLFSNTELQRKSLTNSHAPSVASESLQHAQLLFSAAQGTDFVLSQITQNMEKFAHIHMRAPLEKCIGATQKLSDRIFNELRSPEAEIAHLYLARAQGFMLTRDYFQYFSVMNKIFIALGKKLVALQSIDFQFPLYIQKEFAVESENTYYIHALKNQLIVLGEMPAEVQKLADSLFQYTLKHTAVCAELTDDEILQCNPLINPTNILRARLELRLKDMDYPLSVAHKNWILQVIG